MHFVCMHVPVGLQSTVFALEHFVSTESFVDDTTSSTLLAGVGFRSSPDVDSWVKGRCLLKSFQKLEKAYVS